MRSNKFGVWVSTTNDMDPMEIDPNRENAHPRSVSERTTDAAALWNSRNKEQTVRCHTLKGAILIDEILIDDM